VNLKRGCEIPTERSLGEGSGSKKTPAEKRGNRKQPHHPFLNENLSGVFLSKSVWSWRGRCIPPENSSQKTQGKSSNKKKKRRVSRKREEKRLLEIGKMGTTIKGNIREKKKRGDTLGKKVQPGGIGKRRGCFSNSREGGEMSGG